MPLTPRSSSTITWRTLLWFFATIVALLAFGFWLGIVPVADASDHQSGVVEPADIPPATDPVQNEHWTDIPPVPLRAPDIERAGTCGNESFSFLIRLWKDVRYAQYFPVVDGKIGAVIATLLFDESGLSRAKTVYVSLPGRAVERMTGEQLMERWPHPCYMVQDVVGMRT